MIIIITTIMRVCVLCYFTCILSSGAEIATYATSEEEFQTKIARKAYELYHTINTSGKFRFPAFNENGTREKLNTPSQYWSSSSEYLSEHDINVEKFTMRPDSRPSAALMDLLEKGGVVECGIIVSLVNQCIALDMLGDIFFDFIKMQEPFVLPSKKTLFLDDSSTDIVPTNPGEFGYIANVADYPEIHQQDFARGENVFCVGKNESNMPIFMRFFPLLGEPETEEETLDYLYARTIDTSDGCDDEEVDKYRDREVWENERFAHQMNFPVYRYSYAEFKELEEYLKSLQLTSK